MTVAAPADGAVPPVESGSPRHLVWLYTPRVARDDISALLTLESEIVSSTRPDLDHTIAHARLAWWQEEAGHLALGRPRHPLGRRLAATFAAAALSPPDLRGLVEVARFDLAGTAFESQAEVDDYLSGWSQGLYRNLSLLLCPEGAARADVERFVTSAGAAVRDIELVARFASDARLGRVHAALSRGSPADTAADIASAHPSWQAQPWAAAQSKALAERLHSRRAALARAAATLPGPWRAPLRAALTWCAVSARLAAGCAAALPLQYDAGRFDALGATWTAWRAALAATRGRVPRALQEIP